jgi:hypothetical protein
MVGPLNGDDLSRQTAKLLALELFREDKISMGRAAELCHTPLAAFMEFAAEHEVPMHYGIAELEKTGAPWPNSARDGCFRCLAAHLGRFAGSLSNAGSAKTRIDLPSLQHSLAKFELLPL